MGKPAETSRVSFPVNIVGSWAIGCAQARVKTFRVGVGHDAGGVSSGRALEKRLPGGASVERRVGRPLERGLFEHTSERARKQAGE